MKLLYRYIVSSMLASYSICIAITMAFYVIVDIFAKFYRFAEHIEAVEQAGKIPESVWLLIAKYYFYHTPLILYSLIPIITLMAAMFTITGMARSNELIPLKSCGINMYRLFIPLLFVTLTSTSVMFILQESVIPKFAQKIQETKAIEDDSVKISNAFYCDREKCIFNIGTYYAQAGKFENIRITTPYPDFRPKTVIEAKRGKWCDSGRGVLLFDGEKKYYSKNGMLVEKIPLPATGYQMQTEMRHINLVFPEKKNLDTLSTRKLREIMRKEPEFSQAKVMFYSRFSFPFSTVVLLFLGIPWILRHHTKNLFVGSGICVIVSGAFYGVHLVCSSLGYTGYLDSMIAAWFPTVLFTSLGISFTTMIHT